MTPTLVIGLPRSRTFWTARWLGADHDVSIYHDLPSLDRMFGTPGYCAVDTVLGSVWRGAVERWPSLRLIVVRRPVDDVVASFARAGVSGPAFEAMLRGYAPAFDDPQLHARADMVCSFDDLNRFEVCRQMAVLCRSRSPGYDEWSTLAAQNLQCEIKPALLRAADPEGHTVQTLRALGAAA